MFRTLKRWFSTEEVKLLSSECERLSELFSDYGHKLEGLGMKIERLSNKYRMRDAREARGPRIGAIDELSPEEQELVDDLRRRGGAQPGQDPFG